MAASATAPEVITVPPPAPRLRPITQSAVDLTIKEIRDGFDTAVGARASTAEGGQARIFGALDKHTRWGQLDAAGYVGWRRGAGAEAGGEVVLRFGRE